MNAPVEGKVSQESEILIAFLQSLGEKGYAYDFLLDDNYELYIISRQADNKLGLISEKGWFDGKKFGKDEFWFDGIDTQETQEHTIIEFRIGDIGVICKLDNDNNIILCDGNEDVVDISDIITSLLTKESNRLN